MNKKTKTSKKSTKAGGAKKRAAAAKRPRETSVVDPKEKRRSPRFPRSKIWSEATRERHRARRDQAIEDAGLVTDRMIKKGKVPKDRA